MAQPVFPPSSVILGQSNVILGKPITAPEGARILSFSVQWSGSAVLFPTALPTGTMAQFTCPQNQSQSLSQILSIWVDATQIPNDVVVFFPDSGFTLLVLGGSQGMYSVYTSGTTLYLWPNGATNGVVTVSLFNQRQPPYLMPAIEDYDAGHLALAPIVTPENVQTQSFILTGFEINGSISSTAVGNAFLELTDNALFGISFWIGFVPLPTANLLYPFTFSVKCRFPVSYGIFDEAVTGLGLTTSSAPFTINVAVSARTCAPIQL